MLAAAPETARIELTMRKFFIAAAVPLLFLAAALIVPGLGMERPAAARSSSADGH